MSLYLGASENRGVSIGVGLAYSHFTVPLRKGVRLRIISKKGGRSVRGLILLTGVLSLAAPFRSNAADMRDGEDFIPYEVFFVDEEDFGRHIFSSQSGEAEWGTEVVIRFPERIVGRDGYIWEALSESPRVETLLQAGTQKYYVTFQKKQRAVQPDDREEEGLKTLNQWIHAAKEADRRITGREAGDAPDSSVIVENTAQNNSRIRQLLTAMEDSEWHYFYLIGKNYRPQTLAIGTGLEAEYSSVEVDCFSAAGDDYTILKAGAKRHWNPESCTHWWKRTGGIPNSCLEQGSETVWCQRCHLEKTVLLPALGHVDTDGDSLCDKCGRRVFFQSAGSRISTILHTGQGEVKLGFTCLDEDDRGSGLMLYLSDEVLGPEITGTCFEEDSSYEKSAIRSYLCQEFVNNSSIGAALCGTSAAEDSGFPDRVGLLLEEEYESYREGISKGSQYFLRTAGNSGEILAVDADGSVVTVKAAGNVTYGARPYILLERPELGERAEPESWSYGDLQVREIGNQRYLFRCIDEDYRGADDTHRKAALFLCDSVIRADVDSSPDALRVLSFGTDNNYKKSDVRSWLSEHSSDVLFGLEPIYTGVNTAYSGSTGEGTFGQADVSLMKPHAIGFQLLDDRLFCLSVEEALRYRDELWRFDGSDKDNPETQISPYSGGYYLRTPVVYRDAEGSFCYSDAVYAVDLNRGNIHAVGTGSTDIGIRPAFALPQG